MKRLVLWLFVVAVLLPVSAWAQAAVIVVRHAERVDSSADSPLSAAGEARAVKLADMLRNAAITKIFTTELQRTIQTAAPTATVFKLSPERVKNAGVDALMTQLQASGPTDTVLVVGHSNTVPSIVQRLGVVEPVAVADDDFGNVFVVVPRDGKAPQLIHLRY